MKSTATKFNVQKASVTTPKTVKRTAESFVDLGSALVHAEEKHAAKTRDTDPCVTIAVWAFGPDTAVIITKRAAYLATEETQIPAGKSQGKGDIPPTR